MNGRSAATEPAPEPISLPAAVIGLLMGLLMAAGIALAIVSLLLWRSQGTIAVSRVTDTAVGKSTTTVTPAPSTTPGALPATSSTSSNTVTTKETTQPSSQPSDAVMGTLLGIATLLLLAGAFFPRITKITLPLGASLELDAEKVMAGQIAMEVAAQVKTTSGPLTDEEKAGVTPAAHDAVIRTAAATAVALDVARRALTDPKGYGQKHVGLTRDDVTFVRANRVLPEHVAKRVVTDALASVR